MNYLNKKIYLFGAINLEWSHNKQLCRLLNLNFDLKIIHIKSRGNINILSLIKYLVKNFKYCRSIPPNSLVFVGFNSLYDVLLLKIYSTLLRKNFYLINEFLVSQLDTYINSKPRFKNDIHKYFLKKYLFCIDYLNLKFSNQIIYDTNLSLKRFNKYYNVKCSKTTYIPIAADNMVFKASKKKSFFMKKKINVIWYGNPSKLHNLEYIENELKKLDKNKFNVNVITDMKNITTMMLNDLLLETHIALGCFSNLTKCNQIVINKEFEAMATQCCLVTSFEKRNLKFLKKAAIFSDNISNTLESLYNDRELLYEISVKGQLKYLNFCSDENLSREYKKVISC